MSIQPKKMMQLCPEVLQVKIFHQLLTLEYKDLDLILLIWFLITNV